MRGYINLSLNNSSLKISKKIRYVRSGIRFNTNNFCKFTTVRFNLITIKLNHLHALNVILKNGIKWCNLTGFEV